MTVNGKNKGNTFERKIANLLSERFEDHTGIKNSFRRNPDSGSFFGGKNTIRSTTHDTEKASFGDIITPSSFKYTIECKHYKTPPSLQSILKQEVTQWDTWIKQAKTDAFSAKKAWFIIIKYNNTAEIVITKEPMNGYIMKYQDYFVNTLEKVLDMRDVHFMD